MENLILKYFFTSIVIIFLANSATGQNPNQLPILLDAESSVIENSSNSISFIKLKINQENNFQLLADKAMASSLDFSTNEWELVGNVYLESNGINIKSQSALIKFALNEITEAIFDGSPVIFENIDSLGSINVSGGAEKINYSKRSGFISMEGDAFLKQGNNDFKGCSLTYDIQAEQITSGSSECGQPVVITITPSE
ncbi:MAG: hypothetical protein CBC38_01925 [Gammaproteobacteria bacterium TMED78]|nr:MAG: hypothetical protein CBC38_01925 [Gammaproteobacteria bacterium TMED78]|tara:strand:+ start:93672 stop:94262 length:591 start_codon:yes stop_codon:yes gene_type:complete